MSEDMPHTETSSPSPTASTDQNTTALDTDTATSTTAPEDSNVVFKIDFLTQSPEDIWRLFLGYLEDCRYLAAFDVYTSLKDVLSHTGDMAYDDSTITTTQHGPSETWKRDMQALLDAHIEEVELLLERLQEVQQALNYQDQEDQWTLGAHMFGVKTWYQLDHSDGSIIIKMEGESDDLPLFEQCVVIHEVDLFHTWIPFCADSKMVKKVSKAELIPYINIGIPPLSRDFCLHAFAADCLREYGKLVIVGKSIDAFGDLPLPLKETGWFHKRMIVKEFKTIVDVKTSTQAKTVIVAHIHPNAPLPQSFLNFIMKNLAGLILYLFNKQVKKISQDPNSEYWPKVEQNSLFYKGWVLPKLREFCDFKGWEQPTIACLGEDGKPPQRPVTSNDNNTPSPGTHDGNHDQKIENEKEEQLQSPQALLS